MQRQLTTRSRAHDDTLAAARQSLHQVLLQVLRDGRRGRGGGGAARRWWWRSVAELRRTRRGRVLTGARPAAAVGQLLVRMGTVGAGTARTRVHRWTAPIELRCILEMVVLLLLLLMLMLMLLVLVHVPLDALLAQQLGPLLAIAKGGIEGVRVTAAATRATA